MTALTVQQQSSSNRPSPLDNRISPSPHNVPHTRAASLTHPAARGGSAASVPSKTETSRAVSSGVVNPLGAHRVVITQTTSMNEPGVSSRSAGRELAARRDGPSALAVRSATAVSTRTTTSSDRLASGGDAEPDGDDGDRQLQLRERERMHRRVGSRNAGSRPAAARPPLLRSKSDVARPVENNTELSDAIDGEVSRWGARHGFEDHYQSEDIISHLASVSDVAVFDLHFLILSPCVFAARSGVMWLDSLYLSVFFRAMDFHVTA